MIRLGICIILLLHLMYDKRQAENKAERPIFSQTVEETI